VNNKIVLFQKCVTGKDELDAAFEILMKWFSLTSRRVRSQIETRRIGTERISLKGGTSLTAVTLAD
jgi:hypothetical protein